MNQTQIAKYIDRLAVIKARQALLDEKAELIVNTLKKEGGGESRKWRASLVRVPEKIVVVKAHKQLRLYPRSDA